MKIVIDAMGGDHAPLAVVQGALDAHKLHNVEIVLVGREEEILKAAEHVGYNIRGAEIIDPQNYDRMEEMMDGQDSKNKKKKQRDLLLREAVNIAAETARLQNQK